MVSYASQHAEAIANPSVTADSHSPFAFDIQQQAALSHAPSTSLIKKTWIASGSWPAPIPGSTIEDLPQGVNAWRATIKQWDDVISRTSDLIRTHLYLSTSRTLHGYFTIRASTYIR